MPKYEEIKRFVLPLCGHLAETSDTARKGARHGIVLSCGMMNPHSTKEYVRMEDLLTGAKLVERLIG